MVTSEVVIDADDAAARARIHEATERAARHMDMGTVLTDRARLTMAKRVILRALRMITWEQVSYNQAVVDALHAIEVAVTEGRDRLAAHFQASLAATAPAAEMKELTNEVRELNEVVAGQRSTILALSRKIATLENLLNDNGQAAGTTPARDADQ
jgi:truncated hemoglobin YjbI